jgi:hypothetical protein
VQGSDLFFLSLYLSEGQALGQQARNGFLAGELLWYRVGDEWRRNLLDDRHAAPPPTSLPLFPNYATTPRGRAAQHGIAVDRFAREIVAILA